MSLLAKLASQTAVYGLSTILGRFLNYLLVPLYTYRFAPADYGLVSEFYAYASFGGVILVLGLETGYFRFASQAPERRDAVYAACLRWVGLANALFLALTTVFCDAIAESIEHPGAGRLVLYLAWILGLDALAALPFARLREQRKAWRFAGIKLAEIGAAIGLNLLFIVYLPRVAEAAPTAWIAYAFDPTLGVGAVFLANLLASLLKLVLLFGEFKFARVPWRLPMAAALLKYSLPMTVVGLAGMINETLDRALLRYLLPYDPARNLAELGVYGACYKLAMLMSLFIQAFRYAGEPFFFAVSAQADAKALYAKVMRIFVIFCMGIFLFVTLFIDLLQLFIGPAYRSGLDIVPILLMANLCLGVYVNQSVWYKLTDRTDLGAWVSVFGAFVTVALNVWWIPNMGFRGSAWATLACYAAMVLVSYALGRKFYPVRYDLVSMAVFVSLGLILWLAAPAAQAATAWPSWAVGAVFLGFYAGVAVASELLRIRRRRKLGAG